MLGDEALQQLDDARVPRRPGPGAHGLEGGRLIEPPTLRSLAPQRRPGIRDRHDARAQRDGLAAQAVGVTAAVEALVVVTDDRQDLPQDLQELADRLAL